ncbi:MAG: type II restriction endonuclease subunit M [bacterium]|nr:type II restriction endonuclease subunit M [bacterium]
MAVLTPQQRNKLETAVKQARKIAELGAFNALKAMAINNPEPFSHMTPEQRSLRNSLRSKARLLGDELPATGAQRIDNLSYELAYETWHKMLFAKFLEANDLLIHTASGVAVTMEDCEELASDEHFTDKWDAAANYASKMLPAIFRTDDPLMQITFAINERIKLEEIIDALEREIFTADDALGWVYQFWQSEAKAIINASGDKIDGAKLPAVTQLFTEPYMVHFLIDNTLGAWWVSRNPRVKPPVKFDYLRLLEDGTPAAGQFEGWPNKTAEVTSLDPCMGSGHFVASLFPVFAALRMHEEGLSKEEATDKVITENLHGLELDARCTQIAAFNLALTAWKFCGHYKELPEMNLACSGIAPKGKVEDWVKLVGKVERADDKLRLENGMKMLYEHFQLAPELGSLLDPTTIKADVFTASFNDLQPVLKKALENEADTEQLERGVMAAGIAKAGIILGNKHTLILTNPPFLGERKQSGSMFKYVRENFSEGKSDLATTFIEKFSNNKISNCFASVSPHNWLFQISYKALRKSIINASNIRLLVELGTKPFQEAIGSEVILVILSKGNSNFYGIDLTSCDGIVLNRSELKVSDLLPIINETLLKDEEVRIVLQKRSSDLPNLSMYADSYAGILNGDTPSFIYSFWEVKHLDESWELIQSTVNNRNYFSGRSNIIFWEKGRGRLKELAVLLKEKLHNADRRGNQAWTKKGITVSQMGSLFTTIYDGQFFDSNVAVIIPKESENYLPIWAFCNSDIYNVEVRKIDKNKKVTNSTLIKIPFDIDHWQKVAAEKYPNGLPKPYSDDPTQWLFHGHPIKTDNPLHVALARVMGYRWPAESDTEMELADEAKELIEAVKAYDDLSDDDGIFCIPSVNAEQAGADRLRTFLQAVFAENWSNNTISDLLAKEGASSANLEDWLRKEFFTQHCKVFQNRPFTWHIWDGRNDGFSALVNYHKLDKENLSKLIYTYLGDWIRMCEAKKRNEESGAEGLLSAALKLKEKLEAILHGEAPYDIFVRWKPIEQQPIGWEPDLNDGVRLNVRPFVEAGVLRNKFNVKWGVDRGKNPPNSFWGEVRDNDKHLSLEEKRIAREKTNK